MSPVFGEGRRNFTVLSFFVNNEKLGFFFFDLDEKRKQSCWAYKICNLAKNEQLKSTIYKIVGRGL